tara:strand:+ start:4127 stop:4471 length:345 start_codon:yes stop_codon:yes gene_type:complete
VTLGEKQRLFTRLIGKLIEYAYNTGYELTFGDAYRSPEQAKLNAAAGKGIVNSLHCERLAIDLNLFRNGKYLTDSADYKLLGEYWESLGPDCAWGGRFSKPDGNHFSIRHAGRA